MSSLESPHRGDSNEYIQHTIIVWKIQKISLNYRYLLPELVPCGSNYPCLERISMVPKMFEPLRFDCICISLKILMDDDCHLLPTAGDMSNNVRNHTFGHVRLMNTPISLRIRAFWSDSPLSAWRNFASLAIQNAPSEDSDQTARTRRLIWIFAGRTCTLSDITAYYVPLLSLTSWL